MNNDELKKLITENAGAIADLLRDKFSDQSEKAEPKPGEVWEVSNPDGHRHIAYCCKNGGWTHAWDLLETWTGWYATPIRKILEADGTPVGSKPRFGITLWVATDEDGDSYSYTMKPHRLVNTWDLVGGDIMRIKRNLTRWEDEPVEVVI